MKKIIDISLKIVLALALVTPVLGVLGIFPEPTLDLYSTEQAYDFVMTLTQSGYIMWMMAIVFTVCIVLIIRNNMTLVALLLLPITLNIVGFHAFLDGGLFTAGALMGNVLFLINLYFLWQSRAQYEALLLGK